MVRSRSLDLLTSCDEAEMTMKLRSIFWSPVVAVVLLAVSARAQTPSTAAQLAREGRGLTAAQAADLENRLNTEAEDLAARTRLLGYYFSSSLRIAGADATRAARRRHILWFIEHH